jgi:hypothetical protein
MNMNKVKSGISTKSVFVAPSQLVWTDEKLAVLDTKQLVNLLDNLKTQLASGRVSTEVAADLEKRIESRLPARELTQRRKRQAAAEGG